MAEYKLILPSMGEGVMEATIISWLFAEGDMVKEDDSVVEIATDKVDSDVPTPASGKIVKKLKQKDEVAKIGEVIAILEIAGEGGAVADQPQEPKHADEVQTDIPQLSEQEIQELDKPLERATPQAFTGDLYLSPLVKNIAQQENISEDELKSIKGTGMDGRITKENILAFIENRSSQPAQAVAAPQPVAAPAQAAAPVSAPVKVGEGDEVIQMDRVRKIIADAMVNSKRISPHVTSFIE